MEIETHPIPPFLPENAKVLISGSFPPPKARWCMDWFYPNPQNDMWRIMGYLATGDKTYFLNADGRTFDKSKIVSYCTGAGMAFTDTGEMVQRLKSNASDKYLQVVKPRDFSKLIDKMPDCHTIILTGEKAVETLGSVYGFSEIKVGEYIEAEIDGRAVKVWRMPSSSRAFPRTVEWKAEYYRRPLEDAGCHYLLTKD